MNTQTRLSSDGVIGFFELDDDGVIRYCRPAASTDGAVDSAIGEDFFEHTRLQNRDELMRRFHQFLSSRDGADSFPFDCMFENGVVHTRITFTRAFKTDSFPPEGMVMISIREGQ